MSAKKVKNLSINKHKGPIFNLYVFHQFREFFLDFFNTYTSPSEEVNEIMYRMIEITFYHFCVFIFFNTF